MVAETLYRKYGSSPISVVVLHGGPGGMGEMAPVAQKLSSCCGILELFSRGSSIEEELLELKAALEKETEMPVILIGYSFGAWLGCLFAATFPALVRKLLLISCPPFEEKYVPSIMQKRLERISSSEVEEFNTLKKKLGDPNQTDKNTLFALLGQFFQKVDSFEPTVTDSDLSECSYTIFEKVWKEAQELRLSGALVKFLEKIVCPITAFHGEWDPHPSEGAFAPLSRSIHNFKGILLKECGHTPWIERKAQDRFFALLKENI